MFSFHITLEKKCERNASITGNFGSVFEKTPAMKSLNCPDVIVFKIFSVYTKTQTGVYKFDSVDAA